MLVIASFDVVATQEHQIAMWCTVLISNVCWQHKEHALKYNYMRYCVECLKCDPSIVAMYHFTSYKLEEVGVCNSFSMKRPQLKQAE